MKTRVFGVFLMLWSVLAFAVDDYLPVQNVVAMHLCDQRQINEALAESNTATCTQSTTDIEVLGGTYTGPLRVWGDIEYISGVAANYYRLKAFGPSKFAIEGSYLRKLKWFRGNPPAGGFERLLSSARGLGGHPRNRSRTLSVGTIQMSRLPNSLYLLRANRR